MALLPKKDNTQNVLGVTRIPILKGLSLSNTSVLASRAIPELDFNLKAAGYTDKQLNIMSKNDKIFALRKTLGPTTR